MGKLAGEVPAEDEPDRLVGCLDSGAEAGRCVGTCGLGGDDVGACRGDDAAGVPDSGQHRCGEVDRGCGGVYWCSGG